MNQREIETSSANETFALGERLGQLIRPGDFVGLIGQLGAGKTQLVRGIAEGAGVPRLLVASPTFAIVYPYRGRIPVYHADFYRVADYDELYATGFFDLVGGDGAVLVEWLDRIPQAAPADWLSVELVVTGQDARTIRATAHGARSAELMHEWLG